MKKMISLVLSVLLVVCALVPMTAFAAPFTSSPTAPGVPGIVQQEYNGKMHNALIIEGFDWGNDVVDGLDEGEIIVTPSEDIDNAPPEVDKDRFEDAEDDLKNKPLDQIDSGFASNAVIKDLFDVTVTGKYGTILDSGHSLQVTFKVGNVDGEIKAMYYGANGWELIKNVKNNGDGTVTLLIPGEGPVAFVVEPSGAKSPATSDGSVVYLGVSMVAMALAFCCVAASKTGKKVEE